MSLIIFKPIDSATGQPLGGVLLSAVGGPGPWQARSNPCGDCQTELTPGHYEITFSLAGYTPRVLPADLADPGVITVGLDRAVSPLPPVPTREALLLGATRQQGRLVQSLTYGWMPWWGACWAWLTREDRAHIAPQLLAGGDTICLIERPSGVPLYDEGNQFYSPDKFGPLSMSDQDVAALIAETLGYGFAGCWVFLGGDDGQAGFPIAVAQTQALGPALTGWPGGTLHPYVVQLPGWDGVWHAPNGAGTGYTREQLQAFAAAATAAGALYVGAEHGTGYALAGKGAADFAPGGVMHQYALILGEFDYGRFDGSVWQILARCLPPGQYVRPPDQPTDPSNPQSDLPPHPFYLVNGAVYRVFEFGIYEWVRGEPTDRIDANRQRFTAMGAPQVC